MLKRTPLFESHKELGGKLIEFGGWEMPVQYTGIMDEHIAVRTAAGIFDISHMGEVRVKGGYAADFLNYLLTNDVRKLAVGWGQYTLMCNESGGAIDDLYVYRLAESEYLLIVNASRIDADLDSIRSLHAKFPQAETVTIEDISEQTGAVAVQGPVVASFIEELFTPVQGGPLVANLLKNQIGRFCSGPIEAWVSRTGYTGEDGFEVVASSRDIAELWEKLIQTGRPHGLKPAGLGARDTLRTEACYPLYGHELDDQTGPVEAGLGFFVAFEKGDFIGRTALLEKKTKGPSKKLMAFKTVEKSAPPRPGYTLWSAAAGGEQIGVVASGTLSPSLGAGIGLAYLKPEAARVDAVIQIEARGRRSPVLLCKKPLYRKPVDQPALP